VNHQVLRSSRHRISDDEQSHQDTLFEPIEKLFPQKWMGLHSVIQFFTCPGKVARFSIVDRELTQRLVSPSPETIPGFSACFSQVDNDLLGDINDRPSGLQAAGPPPTNYDFKNTRHGRLPFTAWLFAMFGSQQSIEVGSQLLNWKVAIKIL
jgi:hypothetical protein